jgi:hypothetical protein
MLVNLKKAPYNPVQRAETGQETPPRRQRKPRGAPKRDENRRHHAMPSSTFLHNPRAHTCANLAQLRISPDAHRHAGISR